MSPVHHMLKAEGFQRRLVAGSGGCKEFLGGHHCGVEPVNLSKLANAASQSNIRPIYFENNVGDFVFRQSKCVRHLRRQSSFAHFRSPDNYNTLAASETGLWPLPEIERKRNRVLRTREKYALCRCSTSEHDARDRAQKTLHDTLKLRLAPESRECKRIGASKQTLCSSSLTAQRLHFISNEVAA